MANYLLANAAKLEVNQMHMGIVQHIVQRSGVYALLPWKQIAGAAYQYTRRTTLPTASWVAEDGSLSSASSANTQVTATPTTLYAQSEVSGLAQAMGRSSNSVANEIQAMAESLGNEFKSKLIAGSGSSNQISGIKTLATAASRDNLDTAATDGSAITFSRLRALRDSMNLGISAYICSYRTHRSIEALLDAAGGATYGDIGNGYKRPVLMFDGIPVLPDDAVVTNETQGATTTCARVHAVYFDEVNGLTGLYAGEYPLGFNFENLGKMEGKDNTILRLLWYVQLINHSIYAVGSIKGVTN